MALCSRLIFVFLLPGLLCLWMPHGAFGCIESEKLALLGFKSGLQDPDGFLSSWGKKENCCKWMEVGCSTKTGHVVSLDLFFYNLRGEINSSLLGLQHLHYLDLSANNFDPKPIPKFLGAFKKLKFLDLQDSGFTGVGDNVQWLAGLTSLKQLDISRVNFSGATGWQALGKLPSISYLRLSNCSLTKFPLSMPNVNFSSLSELVLTDNSLGGTIPQNISTLENLEWLDLSSNLFSGMITEAHFANLSRLKSLVLSDNPNLALNISHNWKPPFQLLEFSMSNSKVGPSFPTWLCTQKQIEGISMTDAGISDIIPNCFWSSSTRLSSVVLSQNKIHGELHLPLFIATKENMKENLLTSAIPERTAPNLFELDLSRNHISGEIPISLCSIRGLQLLDLSSNNLSGMIPKCWSHLSNLQSLNLSSNNLLGRIPKSICSTHLSTLHLENNNFTGDLSFSKSNCTNLVILDIARNKLNSIIPTSLGYDMPALKILRLKSNMLTGTIPSQLSNLSHLRVLDLSHNNLSGPIPRSFCKFEAMKISQQEDFSINSSNGASISLDINGRELLYYFEEVGLLVSINLAGNNLSGIIPEELGDLLGVVSLNLSNNNLNGGIIQTINKLQELLYLDLSRNQLSGPIPSSLSTLHFLSYLNLSYNNLSGQIPSGNQLNALDDPLIYYGNYYLCGFPLKPCHVKEPPLVSGSWANDNNWYTTLWFYLGGVMGFVVGFWVVCGSLMLKTSWRTTYFQSIDGMYTKIYVSVAVYMTCLCRKMAMRV